MPIFRLILILIRILPYLHQVVDTSEDIRIISHARVDVGAFSHAAQSVCGIGKKTDASKISGINECRYHPFAKAGG